MSQPSRDQEKLERIVHEFLGAIGEDPAREGLRDTPQRVADAWRDFMSGYAVDLEAMMAEGVFEERHDGMVLVRDIEFYSICEHHLVPFFGTCNVAYVPDRRVVGLSKIARVVEAFARRLQMQERMTEDIARALDRHLSPRGVAVQVEARHLCMMMRGVEKHGAVAVTSVMLGDFKDDPTLAAEFCRYVGRGADK